MRAILHIGPMKTGSTAIQAWLAAAAEELRKAGIVCPRSLSRNASRLAQIALTLSEGRSLGDADRKRLQTLQKELAAIPPEIGSVIISGELMGQGLRQPHQVKALKSLLDPFFDDYCIVAYLRRQDEQAVSMHSTRLRRGDPSTLLSGKPFDYDALLASWADVFGRAAICPRIYDRSQWPSGSIVSDLCAAAGIDLAGDAPEPGERNPSLSPAAQSFLSQLAPRLRKAGFAEALTELPDYETVSRVLDRSYGGGGTLPSRKEAMAFLERARESNERVRAAWFPDRMALFGDDLSKYPETPAEPPGTEAILDVALAVLSGVLVASHRARLPGQQQRNRVAIPSEERHRRG